MKPQDANGKLAPTDRPFRVLVIAGSNRRQYDCPGIDSKARTLMFRMADRLPPEWEIDLEDIGKVVPGRYRAYGHRPPSHVWADLKTKWRGLRMAVGKPIPGSSPAIQQDLGLNRDASIHYKKGEGARLRD